MGVLSGIQLTNDEAAAQAVTEIQDNATTDDATAQTPSQVPADDQITAALRDAGLGAVLKRAGGLDGEHDWPSVLSLGEQQQITLTRLLLARPAFAVLDRVGDTLKPDQVRAALRRLSEAGSPARLWGGNPYTSCER